jgi:hypothetical protein
MHNLKNYNQWILWRPVPQPDGSVKKLPCAGNGQPFDAHDTSIHMSYDQAVQAAEAIGAPYQVGFDITAQDPFFFMDIDDCLSGGNWTPNAVEMMQRLSGAAVMLSQSGRGLHIVGQAAQYPGDRRVKAMDGTFDGLFTQERFIALTGTQLAGSTTADLTLPVHQIIAEKLPPKIKGDSPDWADKPAEGYTCTLSDMELIEKALRSNNAAAAFGGGVTFASLWSGDGPVLGQRWPDYGGQGREFDHTAADAALAAHLAWWTGHNPVRIERIMRMSALVREKWDARPDYIEETILGACANVTGFYNPEAHKEQKQEQITQTLGPAVDPYCDVLAQRELFAGHVYVHNQHCVFTPDGTLHTPAQYRAMYGGRVYAMDRDGTKNTRNAWEALTESVDLRCPRVSGTAFRPKLPSGQIVEEFGRQYVNCYVPAKVPAVEGDVSPFLEHVAHLLPDVQDQTIVLDYMAALVQRPGVKFQWCPVIQGVTGNGKTMLYKVLEYAVSPHYSHKVNASDIDNKFNAWVQGKILGCVEEIRIAGDRARSEMLKELITNDRMPVQGKTRDQITGDNFVNFIMFSNHKDAVLKTADDRRYAVFYCAQQEVADVRPDTYYARMFEWLESGGYSHVAHYLRQRQVVTNVLGRAPGTSSTREAMRESLGVAEQIVLDNLELGTLGFRADIISSSAVNYALAAAGRKMGPRAINSLMRDLGYERHPGTFCVNNERFRAYVPVKSILTQSPENVLRERYIAANTNAID